MHSPLRLDCRASALIANLHALQARAGSVAGAAIKADGYGLGAAEVARHLLKSGCRDFFVSTWAEASQLSSLPAGSLAVLHGFQAEDTLRPGVRPVLVSVDQVTRWKQLGDTTAACDVMVDTGMNRLGLSLSDVATLDGLVIHTLHSHLACADEDHVLNLQQLGRFRELRAAIPAQRYSLANSAGIFLGRDYAFDLVRPGLSLYGGKPRAEAQGCVAPVFDIEAQIVQVRTVRRGESIGYNATFVAPRTMSVAVLNIGYADGFWRAFSNLGTAHHQGAELPIVGRVSMDLTTIDISRSPELRAGDWVTLDFDLQEASSLTGYSQYELLTGLGQRLERTWR